MTRQWKIHLVALLLAVLAVPSWAQDSFLPGLPDLDLHHEPGVQRTMSEVDVVRDMYGRVRTLVQGSGYEFELQVDEFETFYEDEFNDITPMDIISFRGHVAIRLDVGVFKSTRLRDKRVHVKPSFVLSSPISPDSKELGMTYQEVLDKSRVSGNEKGKRPVVAVTSFRVSLRFDGRDLVYKAAVLWREGEDGNAMASNLDRTIENLATVIKQTAKPTPYDTMRDITDNAAEEPDYVPLSDLDPGPAAYGCEWYDAERTRPTLSDHGTAEHSSMFHQALLGIKAVCVCRPNCLASCDPEWSARVCQDFGSIAHGRIHKVSSEQTLMGDDRLGGATCQAALGCAVSTCVEESECADISFNLSVLGNGASYRTGPGALESMNLSNNLSCPCEALRHDEEGGCAPGLSHEDLGHSH